MAEPAAAGSRHPPLALRHRHDDPEFKRLLGVSHSWLDLILQMHYAAGEMVVISKRHSALTEESGGSRGIALVIMSEYISPKQLRGETFQAQRLPPYLRFH